VEHGAGTRLGDLTEPAVEALIEKLAQRLAMLTYLPTRSLFTRATKSSGLKSTSSTLALSLAAM
jgi:hypothetical protein